MNVPRSREEIDSTMQYARCRADVLCAKTALVFRPVGARIGPYNGPFAMRLAGPLNVGALDRTLNEIQRRHGTLRTTFRMIDGQPHQLVSSAAAVRLPVIDLSGLPVADRDAEIQRLCTTDATRPFDLASGPVWRRTARRSERQRPRFAGHSAPHRVGRVVQGRSVPAN